MEDEIIDKSYHEYLNSVFTDEVLNNELHIVISNDDKHKFYYNLMDSNGNLVLDNWYFHLKRYSKVDYFVGLQHGGYYIFDLHGKKIYDRSFENCNSYDFDVFHKVKMDGHKEVYLSKDGHLLNNYKYIYEPKSDEDYTIAYNTDGFYYYIDLYGNKASYGYVCISDMPSYKSININNKVNDLFKSFNISTARKTLFGYKYIDSNNRCFKLSQEPLHDFDNYILVKDCSNLYLYNKINTSIVLITNNMKFSELKLKINGQLLIYGNSRYFITKYNIINVSNLKFDDNIHIKDNVDYVMTFDEYKFKYLKNHDLNNQLQIQLLDKKALLSKERQKKELEFYDNEISELMNKINEIALLREKISKFRNNKKGYIDIDILFITIADHKEINPLLLELNLLNYINLSGISFDNVKVSGIDFSNTNACINPQTVYHKDMSNGNYDGLFFGCYSFCGVNITNSSFNCDFVNLSGAINNSKRINLSK